MNGIDTHWAYGDVIEVVTTAREALDVIIVPKVRRARDVWWVDMLLTQLEETLGLRKRIALEVLIEETEGLQHVDEIATASDRLEAIIFGAGDFSASQGARVDTNFDPSSPSPATSGTPARVRSWSPRAPPASTRSTPPTPTTGTPAAYRRVPTRAAAGLPRQVGDPPEPGGHRQRGVRPPAEVAEAEERSNGRLSTGRGRQAPVPWAEMANSSTLL